MDRSSRSSAVAPSGARDWWLRTVLVLQAPRAVFLALRDDTADAAADRAEPVLLVILLAGIATVLSTGTAGRLLDDSDYDGVVVAIWAFLGGALYGIAGYWLFGALLHGGVRALGSRGSYRRTRHLLAFAAVPVALSLVLLPVKLALYGADLFHRGGSDSGSGGEAFGVLSLAFLAWAVALLFVGVRAVHGWTSGRSAAAVALALALPVAISLAAASL
jgi:hypothetical protein